MIGKIHRLPLREVWKHEALDFTKWLAENIEVLADVLRVPLSSVEREQDAGDFSVDLVAEDESGEVVVIENQLERSNHDHLGKLLTYLAALDARTAVWVVADPRPEHIRAADWLNQSGLAKFFIVQLEAIRIGDSPPAPLLTLSLLSRIRGCKYDVHRAETVVSCWISLFCLDCRPRGFRSSDSREAGRARLAAADSHFWPGFAGFRPVLPIGHRSHASKIHP